MTPEKNPVPESDLSRYLAILRRRWTVCLSITLIGGALAVAYLAMTPVQVTASTLVNVNVISSSPFNTGRASADLVDAQTEVQMARSSAVIQSVADELGGGRTSADVRTALAVTVLPEATVVRISYTAAT
ncbi:MAG: Wzz/FepE/Etk N-terminal domain-containing protein, partial [Microthrixaceae bacterium]